jgi:serine/threonine-protein kinase
MTLVKVNPPSRAGSESDREPPRVNFGALPTLTAGRALGDYRLLEWLGNGAEGDVWKAVRRETGSELVALKILKPSLASNPARNAQFRREAERGTGLIGPSLLTVRELNQVDGYYFMTLPYVEATSLRDVIKRRHAYFSRGDIDGMHHFAIMGRDEYLCGMTRTLAKAARALASAHRQRIVHRDIKPANILIDNRRREGVYLCDFGLGRDLDVATTEQMRDGAGTPMYMAPERLMRLPADEIKCDIYSMGVTLCEALTLKRPFHVPDEIPLSALAPYLACREPLRPRVLDPELPDDAEAIIMKAMARDAARRFASADDLASDLEEFASEWSFRCGGRAARQPYSSAPVPVRVRSQRLVSVPQTAGSCIRPSAMRSEFGSGSVPDVFDDSGPE